MTASKSIFGCAVILFLLASAASAISLTSHAQTYTAFDYVKGHKQVLNPCYKALPEDKNTLFEWDPTLKKLTITSCSLEPAKAIKRECPYTLGDVLKTDGVEFHLQPCNILQTGVGCVDPVPGYLTRLSSVVKLELLSDRFNFRDAAPPSGNIQLVTQNKH